MGQQADKFQHNQKLHTDPFLKLSSVIHLVCNHLGGQDILTASKVSTSWYNSISNSDVCMKKIKLKFILNADPQLKSSQYVSAILESKRNYVNIDFECPDGDDFETRSEVLFKFSKSVVHLKIDNIQKPIHYRHANFTKLKSLEIGSRVLGYFVDVFFNFIIQSDLEKLSIQKDAFVGVFQYLLVHSGLKELSIFGSINFLFTHRDTSFMCKKELTKLEIGSLSEKGFGVEDMLMSFEKFISSQSKLEHVRINETIIDFLEIIMKLPNLKTLEFGTIRKPYNFTVLTVSKSVEFLVLSSKFKRSQVIKLLKVMPNLKSLYWEEANEKDKKVLGKYSQGLKIFKASYN